MFNAGCGTQISSTALRLPGNVTARHKWYKNDLTDFFQNILLIQWSSLLGLSRFTLVPHPTVSVAEDICDSRGCQLLSKLGHISQSPFASKYLTIAQSHLKGQEQGCPWPHSDVPYNPPFLCLYIQWRENGSPPRQRLWVGRAGVSGWN